MSSIAIDIDNTLYSFDLECREAFFELAIEKEDRNYLRGAYAPQVEWRSLADVLGYEALAEAIEKVHNRTLDQPPYKGAVETVKAISESRHEIKYVTTRQDKYATDTKDWLDFNSFPKGEIICSGQDKLEHIRDCQYLIDDRPRTILNFIYDFDWKNSQADIEGKHRLAFGLWFPYNQALTDVKNVLLAPTWLGIKYYLDRKGVLL